MKHVRCHKRLEIRFNKCCKTRLGKNVSFKRQPILRRYIIKLINKIQCVTSYFLQKVSRVNYGVLKVSRVQTMIF